MTVDASTLASYLENIKKLQRKPEVPRPLSTAEKEILISKAQAIYIQAEVASDILLDGYGDRLLSLGANPLRDGRIVRRRLPLSHGNRKGARVPRRRCRRPRVVFDRAFEVAVELKRPDYAAGVRIARARLMAASGDLAGARREIGRCSMTAAGRIRRDYRGGDAACGPRSTIADGDYESAGVTAMDRGDRDL